jgi:outer membrane lipopolysaccharide assembly protein LptE/RlpB
MNPVHPARSRRFVGRPARRSVGVLLALLTLATTCSLQGGCAYSLKSGRVREGLERIAVPYFENESTEPTIEVRLTEDIIQGLIDDRTLQVVDEAHADAVVRGVVQKYLTQEAHYGANRQAEEYEVQIVVEVTVVSRSSGENIAGPQKIRGVSSYRVESGAQGEQAAREDAINQIVRGILNLVIEEW